MVELIGLADQPVGEFLREFGGFPASQVKPRMFQTKGRIFMFGREPVRIDILTDPSAVDFEESYARRNVVVWDGLSVPLISFEDLKKNKAGSGRPKDLADLDNLPEAAPRTSRKRKPSATRRKPRGKGK